MRETAQSSHEVKGLFRVFISFADEMEPEFCLIKWLYNGENLEKTK